MPPDTAHPEISRPYELHPKPDTAPLAGLHLLLAEDAPDSRLLVRRLLEKAGAEVDTAEDGRAAVQRAQQRPPDVLLMDLEMPGMDGLQAARALRAAGATYPILALSGHESRAERQAAKEAGFSDYLTKPVHRDVLTAAVARLAGRAGAAPVEREEPIRCELADNPDLADLVARFVGRLDGRLLKLSQAVSLGDCERVRRMAHQLKGAGGSYGLPALSDQAKALEQAAAAGDLDLARLALNALTGIVRRITVAPAAKENL